MTEEDKIKIFLHLVDFEVGRMSRRLPPWVDRDDMRSAAKIALVHALRRYDENDPMISGKLRLRIRGAIIDWLRADNKLQICGVKFISLDSPVSADRSDVRISDTVADEAVEQSSDAAERNESKLSGLLAVSRMPARTRRIIELRLSGMTLAEIAFTLGITESAVSLQLKRALAQLEGENERRYRSLV